MFDSTYFTGVTISNGRSQQRKTNRNAALLSEIGLASKADVSVLTITRIKTWVNKKLNLLLTKNTDIV